MEGIFESQCRSCFVTYKIRTWDDALCGTPTVLLVQQAFRRAGDRETSKRFSLLDPSLGMTIAAWLRETASFAEDDFHNPDGLAVCLTARIVNYYRVEAMTYLLALEFTAEELTPFPLHQLMKLMMYCKRELDLHETADQPLDRGELKRLAIASLTEGASQ